MKSNFIHICFVIDESGSMSSSVNDVIGGFNKLIKERKSIILDDPGITRDRIYGTVTYKNKTFRLIDTGGIDISKLTPYGPEGIAIRGELDYKKNEG